MLLGITLAGVAACGSSSKATSSTPSHGSAPTRTVTDIAGRTVKVPSPGAIHRIVMVGAPPAIDGFVIAMGDGDLIVNGVPKLFSAAHLGWKILEPRLVGAPNVESNIEAPVNTEELVALKPDIVFADTAAMAEQIQKLGIPAVVITEYVSGSAQQRTTATLVGNVLGKQAAAAAYVSYLDDTVKLVTQRIHGIPQSQRPSALYLSTRPFRRNGPGMVWYLNVLGARDAAGNIPPLTQFNNEQILKWNPGYIIAHDPTDVPIITQDPVLKSLTAVREGQVRAVPQDLNEWGDYDIATPLGLLWTAKFLYPKRFADIDIYNKAKAFYARFFHENLSDSQLKEILYGIGGSKVNFGA